MVMQKNQYFEAECIDMSHDGQGVVKVDSFTYFVKDMLLGEYGKLKVIKVLKNYGIARLIELKKSSNDRVTPKCPVYQACGGCQLQHMSYEGQVKYKTKRVKEAMKRIGKTKVEVNTTLGMKEPWFYRNKSQLPVGNSEEGLISGFYKKHSNDIIRNDECFIQSQVSNQVVRETRAILDTYGIRAYDKRSHKGIIRHILVKYGFRSNEVMLVLIINAEKLVNEEMIVKDILKALPTISTIVLNTNMRRDNVILGNKERVLYGRGYIEDMIDDIRFQISSKSFYQVNPIQTEVLYQTALEYTDLKGNEVVLDAYCGIGSISLFLARKAKKVIGVEIVKEAIEDARINAKINGIDNVEFHIADAGDFMLEMAKKKEKIDVVVVDPPRKGCSKEFLEAFIMLGANKMVYISCDVATQARDIEYLEQYGYEAVKCQPCDMFPQTTHVESVVQLSNRNNID